MEFKSKIHAQILRLTHLGAQVHTNVPLFR